MVDYKSTSIKTSFISSGLLVHRKTITSDKANFLDSVSACAPWIAPSAVPRSTTASEREPSGQFPCWANSLCSDTLTASPRLCARDFRSHPDKHKWGVSSTLRSFCVFHIIRSRFTCLMQLVAEQGASGSHLSVSIKAACDQDCRQTAQKQALGRGFKHMPYRREQENVFKGRYLLNPTYN